MAFRITFNADDTMSIVRIDGWLTRDAVPALRTACSTPVTAPVALDLSAVRSIDCDALDELRTLLDQGVRLVSVPTYIRILLAG